MNSTPPLTTDDIAHRLRDADIAPTKQRVAIARVLFEVPDRHLSAQDVLLGVNRRQRHVCRATVYNTLHLFVGRGLVREIPVDAQLTFYDANTDHHHHIFNVDTGELFDVPSAMVEVNLPPLPEHTRHDELSLIIRVRNRHGTSKVV